MVGQAEIYKEIIGETVIINSLKFIATILTF